MDKPYIILEDDTRAYPGDVVYNYYDMQVVRIPSEGYAYNKMIADIGRAKSLKRDVWVQLEAWLPIRDGNEGEMEWSPFGGTLLNGERMCSMEFAKRRDFRGAKEFQGEVS